MRRISAPYWCFVALWVLLALSVALNVWVLFELDSLRAQKEYRPPTWEIERR